MVSPPPQGGGETISLFSRLRTYLLLDRSSIIAVMNSREFHGTEMAQKFKITWTGKHYLVPSQSGTGTYRVDAAATFCTCKDFELHQKPCKHILAVRIVKA